MFLRGGNFSEALTQSSIPDFLRGRSRRACRLRPEPCESAKPCT